MHLFQNNFSIMYKILIRRPRSRYLCICIVIVIYLIFDIFGILHHFFEKDFFKEFDYPYNGDIQNYVVHLRLNMTPGVPPINYYNYSIENNVQAKCVTSGKANTIRLVYLIKSSVVNKKNRAAIRKTWGYEQRFSDVEIRTVFLIGKSYNTDLDQHIEVEASAHKDIVIMNYYDNYYNNTIKSMMGFKWAVTFCPNAQFYMFVDDDYYISTRNVLRYIRNPTNYPDYIKSFLQPNYDAKIDASNTDNRRNLPKIMNLEEFNLATDARFYSGFVFQTHPHRHKTSKWYVSLEEYPYHLWPPYVTAGAYILSKESLFDLFYTSYYTKHFRFDDIYVGLLAIKAHIEPLHCEEFYYYKKKIDENTNSQYVIASHGYENPEELISVWNLQRGLGNA